MSLIHRYQSNGYNIVLDINSGCIHLVDLVTYEVLPFMEEGLSEQEIVDKLKDQYPEAACTLPMIVIWPVDTVLPKRENIMEEEH